MTQGKEVRIVWEHIVHAHYMENFRALYAHDGAWVQFFKKHEGYIKTELIQDVSLSHRFLTIDHWASLSAYSDMKNRSRKEYRTLDECYEKFTMDENYIGIFETV